MLKKMLVLTIVLIFCLTGCGKLPLLPDLDSLEQEQVESTLSNKTEIAKEKETEEIKPVEYSPSKPKYSEMEKVTVTNYQETETYTYDPTVWYTQPVKIAGKELYFTPAKKGLYQNIKIFSDAGFQAITVPSKSIPGKEIRIDENNSFIIASDKFDDLLAVYFYYPGGFKSDYYTAHIELPEGIILGTSTVDNVLEKYGTPEVEDYGKLTILEYQAFNNERSPKLYMMFDENGVLMSVKYFILSIGEMMDSPQLFK